MSLLRSLGPDGVWIIQPQHTRLEPSMWIATTKPPGLALLQGWVGGYVEAVYFGDGVGWLNEEGKLQGLPINELATMICHTQRALPLNDYIAGPLVITVGKAVPG